MINRKGCNQSLASMSTFQPFDNEDKRHLDKSCNAITISKKVSKLAFFVIRFVAVNYRVA